MWLLSDQGQNDDEAKKKDRTGSPSGNATPLWPVRKAAAF